jgi:hypothetical protein
MSKTHPFYSGTYDGRDCFYMTTDDRVKRVAEFDLETCHRALELKGLQATVRGALERRVRKLKRDAKPKKPPPAAKFAVVLNPGTLLQAVDVYAATLRDAEQWAAGIREPGVEVDVMRVLPGGQLTTEL